MEVSPMNAWLIKVAVLSVFCMYYGYQLIKAA